MDNGSLLLILNTDFVNVFLIISSCCRRSGPGGGFSREAFYGVWILNGESDI
jgi:hypothetical protein